MVSGAAGLCRRGEGGAVAPGGAASGSGGGERSRSRAGGGCFTMRWGCRSSTWRCWSLSRGGGGSKDRGGNVVSWRGPLLRGLPTEGGGGFEKRVRAGRSQRHTSIRYGERFVLKLFRRVHWGVNPELELGRFLTERSFPHAAPLAGALEYHRADGERLGVAAVHGWVPKAETGWEYTLRALDRYYERVLSLAGERRKYLAGVQAADATGAQRVSRRGAGTGGHVSGVGAAAGRADG